MYILSIEKSIMVQYIYCPLKKNINEQYILFINKNIMVQCGH